MTQLAKHFSLLTSPLTNFYSFYSARGGSFNHHSHFQHNQYTSHHHHGHTSNYRPFTSGFQVTSSTLPASTASISTTSVATTVTSSPSVSSSSFSNGTTAGTSATIDAQASSNNNNTNNSAAVCPVSRSGCQASYVKSPLSSDSSASGHTSQNKLHSHQSAGTTVIELSECSLKQPQFPGQPLTHSTNSRSLLSSSPCLSSSLPEAIAADSIDDQHFYHHSDRYQTLQCHQNHVNNIIILFFH
ncbi:unnamed protein product [Protopolystoma xenopodis]|uniref:Uncharacterized protein n=1 Tax=Protopolystoma xenopodis TaxID=117903 RepID=A0A448X2Z7_9PLAT|nr:unnamed protein product [Protopolystoma xenopodis]